MKWMTNKRQIFDKQMKIATSSSKDFWRTLHVIAFWPFCSTFLPQRIANEDVVKLLVVSALAENVDS